MSKELIAIMETNDYLKDASEFMSEEETMMVGNYVSRNVELGTVIRGTGGARKIRVAIRKKGKSGGARVIYYYYNQNNPVVLLNVFPKNKKENLTQEEINELYDTVQDIKRRFKK